MHYHASDSALRSLAKENVKDNGNSCTSCVCLLGRVTLVEFMNTDKFGERAQTNAASYSGGGKICVELIKGGAEILVKANQEGFRYLAEVCKSLAAEDDNPQAPEHNHIDLVLYGAPPGSVPLGFLLTADIEPAARSTEERLARRHFFSRSRLKSVVRSGLGVIRRGLEGTFGANAIDVAARHELLNGTAAASQATQILLRMQYRELLRKAAPLPDFRDVEFRCFSQNGEDGILVYLFALLGTTNRKVVELCAGSGMECNAANLIINHGWRGLLIDGDPEQIAVGKEFYARCKNTFSAPPTLVASWVTPEIVNDLLRTHDFAGEIDLLSLDMDGNDYWVWRALDCIRPRVIILEFNAGCGPEKSLTMRYDPDFRPDYSRPPYRFGASLPAFVKLAREKGYRLVGVQSLGFNALFIQTGVGEDLFPERSPEECFARNERLSAWSPSSVESMLKGRWWVEV